MTVAAFAMFLCLAFWWVAPWHTARPITVTGIAYSNEPQTAIGLSSVSWLDSLRYGLKDGTGFSVAEALWTGPEEDAWHASGPVECLTAVGTTRVELTYVEIAYGPWDDGGPLHAVTSIRCLE